MMILLHIFSGLVSCCLLAKLYEITYHIVSAIRISFLRAKDIQKFERYMRHPEEAGIDWPVMKHLIKLPPTFAKVFFSYVFRYRSLVLLQCAVLFYQSDLFVVVPGAVILFTGVWIEIVRILTDRLVFGPYDDFFRIALESSLLKIQGISDAAERMGRQLRLQRFIRLFAQLGAITVVSYVAMYCAVDNIYGSEQAFTNVPNDFSKPLHFLYFSLTTLSTVGFGDITPKDYNLIARLLVSSEVLAGFAILIVLITSVSLTFEHES